MFLELNVARREERLADWTGLDCTVNERGASRAQLRFSVQRCAWFFLCWESNQSEAEMKEMIGVG